MALLLPFKFVRSGGPVHSPPLPSPSYPTTSNPSFSPPFKMFLPVCVLTVRRKVIYSLYCHHPLSPSKSHNSEINYARLTALSFSLVVLHRCRYCHSAATPTLLDHVSLNLIHTHTHISKHSVVPFSSLR